jgi:hypothetical protein
MNDDLDVLTRLIDYHDHITAPEIPLAEDLRRGRRRVARRRAMAVGGVAAAAAAVVLTASLITGNDPDNAPQPAPSPSEDRTAIDPVDRAVPVGPSEALAARQTGRFRLEVGGEVLPGRWTLSQSRGDVWVAEYFDEVGYMSPALWWGKGTTTHEVPGQRGGVAISQDGRWIVWTRATSGDYSPSPSSPRVMEVVDTATGKVRWSRDADADAPEIEALAVTNDGVVVFGHCLEPTFDIGGTRQCDDARVDVWAPELGRTETLPAEVRVEHGPPGTVAALTPLVQVDGMPHNGLLVRDTPSDRPRYVRVSERGDVEVVATLPRDVVAVTADERFALVPRACGDQGAIVCEWSAWPLDGGEPRPIPSLAELVTIATGYDWPVDPFIVEKDDLLVVRALGLEGSYYPAVARCSLAQARCVRIRD